VDEHDSEDGEEGSMPLDTRAFGGIGVEDLMDISLDVDVLPCTDFSDGESEGGAMPVFDLTGAVPDDGGAWSDSDSEDGREGEEGEGEGEYTGRFKMMTVKTKVDPPTSVTRERMEEWGRPVR
jgi:hypothetical protein